MKQTLIVLATYASLFPFALKWAGFDWRESITIAATSTAGIIFLWLACGVINSI